MKKAIKLGWLSIIIFIAILFCTKTVGAVGSSGLILPDKSSNAAQDFINATKTDNINTNNQNQEKATTNTQASVTSSATNELKTEKASGSQEIDEGSLPLFTNRVSTDTTTPFTYSSDGITASWERYRR